MNFITFDDFVRLYVTDRMKCPGLSLDNQLKDIYDRGGLRCGLIKCILEKTVSSQPNYTEVEYSIEAIPVLWMDDNWYTADNHDDRLALKVLCGKADFL